MGNAFLNDETVRQAALANLAACADTGRLQAGHVAWSEAKCSAVGCLIDSDDLALWESKLGLPAWFALVFETAVGGGRDAAAAVAIGAGLLQAIPLGADLDRAGSGLILRVLDDAAAVMTPGGLEPALAVAMQQITDLHRRVLAGEQIAPADWKTARRSATSLTDTVQEPLQRAVARCVESAAWDPLRSRSAALDTLRQWRNAHRDKDVLAYGWGAERDAEVQAQLNALHERFVVNGTESKMNVFKLYEEHHPEDAAALRAKMAFERENQWRLAALAAPLLLAFLHGERAV